jgi:DNA-binding winged helix-turn-helix (wHTH) protein
VLERLIEARGRAVSVESVHARAWGAAPAAGDVSGHVRTVVARLRRKLGHPPVIETIGREGYRIVPAGATTGAGASEPSTRRKRKLIPRYGCVSVTFVPMT